MNIYYFNTEANAKKCYDKADADVKSAYKLKGNKLFYSDTTGLFD